MKLLIAAAVMLAFFAVSHMFWRSEAADRRRAQYVSVLQANEMLTGGEGYTLIDVRTRKEFDQGHIAGAINIDIQQSDFADHIAALSPDQPVIVYCRSGARSRKALSAVQKLDLPALYHMDGGMLAWDEAALPTTK